MILGLKTAKVASKHFALYTVAGAILATSIPVNVRAADTLSGKLWLVPSDGLTATFPPPSATPDVTFVAKHISFFMNAPSGIYALQQPNLNNAVDQFLGSADAVSKLAFSGLMNPAVGAIVTGSTPVINTVDECSSTTYGTYMEIKGKIRLTPGEALTVSHDDGVSLKIDGIPVSGLTSGSTVPVSEVVLFKGKYGTHSFDLVYANSCGNGLLSFSPEM